MWRVLQVDKYPMPQIEKNFAMWAGGQRFSKFDVTQSYLQMEVEEGSKAYLTRNIQEGLYLYNRLVFAIASAPAI